MSLIIEDKEYSYWLQMWKSFYLHLQWKRSNMCFSTKLYRL